MGSYIATTPKERAEMLAVCGQTSMDGLFAHIPEEVKIKDGLAIPSGLSEFEVSKAMEGMASKNIVFKHIFRGAGAYNHFIPAIAKGIVNKEEFLTAYTPYQAEISQGTLQSIFEYQTMICELTGMDVSNASIYDGASAAAEAVAMCVDRKRTKAYVSATSHPDVMKTIKTYCLGSDTEVIVIPQKDGKTDLEALEKTLDAQAAYFYVQQPNFYGQIEDCTKISEIVHQSGAKFVMGCNPISMAIFKTPAECGADIAVGDGQPLGMPLGFGGPYLGFMAATKAMLRKLPGRIVGETTDIDGKRAFVLTLQAREQHIRREKASSNVCSNQALCALTASVYMASMGTNGMTQVATQCMSKANYFAERLSEIGFSLKFDGEFFHEFVTTCPGDINVVLKALEDKGILGGYPIKVNDEDCILWCTTEKNAKEDMDMVITILREVCGK